ncbi:MAG: carboxypeptidase regulatory-like domain-containing protein [Chitinophagaceae bacterium]|nr:carboxypeptidase regulatory-like domain-containing protein [Chitinophagaceae bacterium]
MKVFSTILFTLFSCKISAQIIISGTIKDEIGKPLSSVSVTLSKKKSPVIVAFSITDNTGNYRISSQIKTDSVTIAINALNYIHHEMTVPAVTATYDFSLSPRFTVLKEVKVQQPPVWQRKDTINYSVSEFKQPQDRVIGDIIARLPGIEVTAGGQIKYNGKPINKYYIEGLDLLEDRYGIANNNIPAGSVDKVQVLENHQPIRVLDSISFSDRAALNIKLKDNAKMKLIGKSRVGVGAAPFLTEDELMTILFKKKWQFINTYKYNNAGTDNTKELTSQNFNDYINAVQNGAVKNDLLSLVQPGVPPVSQKRYLFNNSHVTSLNQLVPINSEYQLRINTYFVNDFQKQQTNVSTKYFLPSDTISINEKNNSHNNQNLLQTDLTLMANTPKYYFRNLLRFQGWWSAGNDMLNTTSNMNQQLNNPFFNVSNDFRLLTTKSKYIHEWSSYIGLVSLPQSLDIKPGLYPDLLNNNSPYDNLLQQASLKTFYTNNYLSVRKKRSGWSSEYKIGFNIQKQKMISDLIIEEAGIKMPAADIFHNNLNWLRYRVYEQNDWSYETEKIRVSLSLPFNYTNISYENKTITANTWKTALFSDPAINIMLQLGPRWNIYAASTYTQSFSDISGITAGYILKNYRNFSNSNAPLNKTKLFSNSVSITFRNPLKIIFFNAGIIHSDAQSDLLYSQEFSGYLQTLKAMPLENHRSQIQVFGRFSKYVIDWKTSFGLNYNYSFGSSEQIQQGEVVKFKNQSYQAGASMNIKWSSAVGSDYSANYSRYFSKSQFQQQPYDAALFNQRINLNYFPSKRWVIGASAEHYYWAGKASMNYFFADANIRYSAKKSKTDYELSLRNIGGTKNYINILLSNNVETVSEYRIRPREILFKMSFSF